MDLHSILALATAITTSAQAADDLSEFELAEPPYAPLDAPWALVEMTEQDPATLDA